MLLLDEFTSAVDVSTERKMMDIILKEFQTCTIIMVSHRLDLLGDMFDRVLVMDKGCIVEDGSPRTLQGIATSRFSQLLRSANVY